MGPGIPGLESKTFYKMFEEMAFAIQALTGSDDWGRVVYGKHIQLETELVRLIPKGDPIPPNLRNGVYLRGNGGTLYTLNDGRVARVTNMSTIPGPVFDHPDVIEQLPHESEPPGEPIFRELNETEIKNADHSRWRIPNPIPTTGGRSTLGMVDGSKLDPVSFTGKYERHPIENDWHIGEITLDSNRQLRWTNHAGVSWSIETPTTLSFETWQNKVVTPLKLGADNPYRDEPEGGQFRFFDRREDSLLGFWFQGEFYTLAGATHKATRCIHWEEYRKLHQPRYRETFSPDDVPMRLGRDQLPYRHTVRFPSTITPEAQFLPPWGVSSVVVLSDWWAKRPTTIKVFGDPVGQHSAGIVMLGQKLFLTNDPKCCGVSGTEECTEPEKVSKLVVPLDGIQWLHELTVEIDGCLSDSGEVNLYSIEVRGYSYNCFLSSACMRARGLPDDCEDLTVLRAFRDNWLARQPGGNAAIREYYDIAPGIVRAIDARPDAAELYADIYDGLVGRAVTLIRDSHFQEAAAGYRHFVESLRKRLGL